MEGNAGAVTLDLKEMFHRQDFSLKTGKSSFLIGFKAFLIKRLCGTFYSRSLSGCVY
jgi:hypothetical protein